MFSYPWYTPLNRATKLENNKSGKKNLYDSEECVEFCKVEISFAKNKKIIESNTVEPETTINKIVERAYYYQDRIGNKKPTEIDKEYDTFLHYVFGFGEKAWEVSKKYGVTVSFSNINKVEEGYHLRDYYIGSEVDKPKEN